jgi:hypothetical protein
MKQAVKRSFFVGGLSLLHRFSEKEFERVFGFYTPQGSIESKTPKRYSKKWAAKPAMFAPPVKTTADTPGVVPGV